MMIQTLVKKMHDYDVYNKGIVKGGKDVSHTKDQLAGTDLGTKGYILLNFGFAYFLHVGRMNKTSVDNRSLPEP